MPADAPSLAGLLRRRFVSELFHQTDGARLDALAPSPAPRCWTGATRSSSWTQWRDSSGTASSYGRCSIGRGCGAEGGRAPWRSSTLETIKDVYTFWEAEKRVVSSLKDRLLDEPQSVDVDFVADLASERKAGHWLSGPGKDVDDRPAVADAYDAIVAAAELFALHTERRHTLSFEAPGDLLAAYQNDLHRFDRLYRRFCIKAKPALGQGWNLLKTLADEVERVYDQGFLQPLGVEWSRLLDEGFLGKWTLEDLPSQRDFYADNIRPHLADSERKRAFVIISDRFPVRSSH